jgi:hypothetical protein
MPTITGTIWIDRKWIESQLETLFEKWCDLGDEFQIHITLFTDATVQVFLNSGQTYHCTIWDLKSAREIIRNEEK